MAKRIEIAYNGDKYTLEFTRDTVRQMERAGFNVDEALATPMSSFDTLFTGAFLANHGRAVKDRIPEKILKGKKFSKDMFGKLIEMYNEPIAEMFDDAEETEGNLEWEANF